MRLPAPLNAAVGFVATAAAEAKRLPDRAIELPMLAVSTALQMSLRAQQRYARLAARGDALLNRRSIEDEPPPWATFDDPVGDAPGSGVPRGDAAQAASLVQDLFGTDRPTLNGVEVGVGVGSAAVPAPAEAADTPYADPAEQASNGSFADPAVHGGATTPADATAAGATAAAKRPAAKRTAGAAKKTAAKKVAAKSAATKQAAVKSTATKQAAVKSVAVKSAAAKQAGATAGGAKTVHKPRNGAPSRFDTVGDDTDTDS